MEGFQIFQRIRCHPVGATKRYCFFKIVVSMAVTAENSFRFQRKVW